MKAIDRLTDAHEAAQAGRHEEALNEYIWFHEHALQEDRALRGVRLSFALSFWKELGEAYPPATAALLALRDRKVSILSAGIQDWELFNDVSALNETLGEPRNTYELFLHVHRTVPDFANRCIRLAMPSLVMVEDFELARHYLGDPEIGARHLIQGLNDEIHSARSRPTKEQQDRRLEAYAQIAAEDLRIIVRILRGSGEGARADAVLASALRAVDDADARTVMSRSLATN